ncbi:hypothetical protein ACFFRR_000163 [Megaselia abdita]
MKYLLIILVCFNLSVSEKVLKFYKIEIKVDPRFVANESCSLTVPSRNRVLANFEGIAIVELKNITVNFRGFKFYNQFRPFLINEWINVCSIFKGHGSFNYFAKTLKRFVMRYGNLIQCLYKPGYYFLKNLEMPYNSFQFFLDTGKYKMDFYVFEGYPLVNIINATLYLEITEDFKNWRKKAKE